MRRLAGLTLGPFVRCTKALQERPGMWALGRFQGWAFGWFYFACVAVVSWLAGMRIGDLGEAAFVVLILIPGVLLFLVSGFLLDRAVASLPKRARATRTDWIIFWTVCLAMPLLGMVTVFVLKV